MSSLHQKKKIIIFAGANGAGKTTFANGYLLNEASRPIFINADLVAAEVAPKHAESAAVGAGRYMLAAIDGCVAHGKSFAFETTLSGRGYIKKIEKWRAHGYYVHLVFLSLRTPEDAVTRVASRVRLGGHNIPKAVIHRRFRAGLGNFRGVYRYCVNSWVLYDNDVSPPILLEYGENQ